MKKSRSKHFFDAIAWVAGTALIGFAPILFLNFISWLSEEHIAEKEIEQLAATRYFLFVCCSITGAIVVSFITSAIRLKGWLVNFAVYVTPFLMLTYLFLKYLMLYVQLGDQHDYGPGIMGTRLTIVFSILYCVLSRTIFNINLENAGRNINL